MLIVLQKIFLIDLNIVYFIRIIHNLPNKRGFMLIVLQLIFNLFYGFLFSEEEWNNSKEKETIVEQPAYRLSKKEEKVEKIDYGYRATSSDYRTEFSGKAFYKVPIQKSKRSDTFITAGAKIQNSSMKLKELSFDDRSQAFAHLGLNKQIQDNVDANRSIQIEIAQPLYDDRKDFLPVLEISYDIKF
jgi:hypothetical protein